MRTSRIAIMAALFLAGCTLLVDEEQGGAPVPDGGSCSRDAVVGTVELSDTLPFDRGTQNLIGRKRFTVVDGRGFVVTPDGRVIRVDLRQPRAPSLGEPTALPLAETTAIYIEATPSRVVVLGQRTSDGRFVLIDSSDDSADIVEWPLDGLTSSDLNLSVAQGCIFAGSGFASPLVTEVGSGSAPIPLENESGTLAIARSGLGLSTLRVVRVVNDGMCGLQSVDIFSTNEGLGAADDQQLWLVGPGAVSARPADGETVYTLISEREIVDLRWLGEQLIVGTERDLLIYRERAPNSEPDAERTIPIDSRIIGLSRVFEDSDRWLAVLVARDAIESPPAMSVLTIDLQELCP